MTNERLLIVDDSLEARQWMIDSVLRPAGYVAAEANTVDEARALIDSFRPHLIVLSVTTVADQALTFMAEHEVAIPIVVTTPYRLLEPMVAALEAGARDVLIKPFEPDRLARAIERGLRATAVQRERDALRERTAYQAQEFNTFYIVLKKIAELLDIEAILSLVVTSAANLMRAEEGTLMLLDPATGELYLRASHNIAESVARKMRAKVRDTLMGRVIGSGRPIMMSGTELVKIQSAFLVKAILSVPLIFRDRVTGVLSVDHRRTSRVFTEHDVHLLSTLADSAAIAIENAQLYQETHRRANEFAALVEIDRHISSTLDLADVLGRIAEHAKELLKADDSEVYLLEPDDQTLRAIVALGSYPDQIKDMALHLGEGLVGHVAQSQVAEMINNAQRDPRSKHVPGTPDVSESLLCAPLVSKDELLGAMVVVRTGEHALFESADLDFLRGLAGQAAIAIENARLYAAEQQRAIELVRALEQQRELDRLKNEFIQNISHELRTPLAIVRGYAELLDNGDLGDLPPAQRESISVMARRSRMLSKMLDDLLAILAAETNKMVKEPVDLSQLVETLIAEFQVPAAQAHLTLRADVTSAPSLVPGDPIHLRRVFDNLLSNAIKFTPAGGVVSVRLARTGIRLVLEVTDTGIGIPPDQLERVFERFYQVDGSTTRRYGGVGLGLALVKEIIESHGGRVMVESEVGKGSTFRVILPATVGVDAT